MDGVVYVVDISSLIQNRPCANESKLAVLNATDFVP